MRFGMALAVSAVVHGLIGFGLWLYCEYAPAPDVRVTLDLSGVELSFSEDENDTAAALPQMSAPEIPKPKAETPPQPKAETLSEPLPEIRDSVDVPRPVEKPRLAPPPLQTAVAAPAPKQARVDAPPRPKRTIRPDYPRGARQRGEQGDVVVEMLVNAQGAVDKVDVIISSGFAELDEAALKAVKAAKFTPAKAGREPVASSARITLAFKLK